MITMLDAATGTLLGTVEAAGDRRIARSALTLGAVAEFTDSWSACQWLRSLYPITPPAPPRGYATGRPQEGSNR